MSRISDIVEAEREAMLLFLKERLKGFADTFPASEGRALYSGALQGLISVAMTLELNEAEIRRGFDLGLTGASLAHASLEGDPNLVIPLPEDRNVNVELSADTEDLGAMLPPIGCLDVQIGGDMIHFHDSEGFMATQIDRSGIGPVVGLQVYVKAEDGKEKGFGLLHQMTANHARSTAHGLLKAADLCDGGKGLN